VTDQLRHRTLQILRKDTERLWWAILLTLALLAYWAFREITRPGFDFSNPVPRGVWLNMVLPFAWTLLIALAIHQDSLVGDRQFWVALPCGWRPLLAAKAAFIAGFIQFPYFLATVAILLARGFNPVEHIPHLFWKQVVLLGLILPAVAVAAVVKNIAQFMLVLITLASGVVLFSTRLNSHYGPDTSWDVRWILTVLVIGVGGLAVAVLQFVRRCTIRSRAIGVVTALAAASLYSWLPRDMSAAIYAAFSPSQPARTVVSLRLSSDEPDYTNQLRRYNFQRTTVLIPVAFRGLPAAAPDAYVSLDQVRLELIRSNGERYESDWDPPFNGIRADRIDASVDAHWQALTFYSPAMWNRLVTGSVTLHGRVLARVYRLGSHIAVRTGERKDIAGVGRCSNTSSMDSLADLRKISVLECESAEVSPARAWFDGASPAFQGLPVREPAFYAPTYYPQDPWLSPLRHGIVSQVSATLPMVWNVAPQTQFDTVIIDYTLPALDLNRYVLHKPVKPEAAK
jgi:hypothetical protein